MQTDMANTSISVEDDILVQQAQQGNTGAMERLIVKYQKRIFNVILKICGNYDDAAELTQETFVKVIENIDKFQGRSGFYTWAFRIGVNLTFSYCKKNSRLRLRSLDGEIDKERSPEGSLLKDVFADNSAVEPADVAENKELCDLVNKSIMKLEEPQRMVLVLRDIEGMNYAQIAEVLNIELGTLKSRLSRARGNLKNILETML